MARWMPACSVGDIPPGAMRRVDFEGRRILVANVDGTFYAIGAVCTHEEGYLDEGDLDGTEVMCPIHFARFSVVTGEVLEGPAETPEPTYPVEVRGDTVYVGVED